MPRFPIPEGYGSEDELFRAEVWKGMDRRYPDGYDEERKKQAEYEIDIICQMGFPAYFLVVADFIMWAKNNGVAVGPGRGSAAGSIVAYALGITDLDPLVHGLIFERFLNPERVSMPDIDIDFDERGRGRRDQVRDPEVGLGPGRADRHLRHDQGQGRDQGLLPGARLPLRARRPDHQGVPARRDGQGHPAVRDLRRAATRGTTRPASSARCTRPKPRSSRSSTPPRASRG